MRSAGPLAVSLLLVACQVATPADYLRNAPPEVIFETMLELASPGPQHAPLGTMVGTFDAEVATWTDPYEEPMRSTGEMIGEWILDGRYVRGTYSGEFLGQPFERLTFIGFDRANERYLATAADTASTWFMPFSTGTLEGNTLTLHSDMFDPTIGQPTHIREAYVFESQDRWRHVTYYSVPGGPEAKSMEIVYTRQR